MTESEAWTRKKRIDEKLKSSLLKWTVIHNDQVDDHASLSNHAVEEFPTETGPADYALFVEGKLLGIIEAKKVSVGAGNVLEQAKRYAKGVPDTVGEWREYKVPFLYSTNGELIFHIDVRKKLNSSHQLFDFHYTGCLNPGMPKESFSWWTGVHWLRKLYRKFPHLKHRRV